MIGGKAGEGAHIKEAERCVLMNDDGGVGRRKKKMNGTLGM